MNGLFSSYTYHPFCLILLFSGVLASGLLGSIRRRRVGEGGNDLLLLLWCVAHWSFASALECAAATVSLKLFWAQVAYPAAVSCPVFFFLFAARYASISGFPPRNWIPLLFVLPAMTFFFALTHTRFHGLWLAITLQEGTSLALYEQGPWFIVHVTYSYALLVVGAILLVRRAVRVSAHFLSQTSVLIAGSLTPLAVNAAYVFGKSGVPRPDGTPVAYLFSGLMLAAGIYRFGILDLVPIARSLLVETMSDGVLVLDPRGVIVDLNPAMASILGRKREDVFGATADETFRDWRGSFRFFEGEEDRLTEVERILPEGGKATFDVQVSTLMDRRSSRRNNNMGKLLVFRDVSPRRKVEEQLREAAFLDPLTGLVNMRAAYRILDEMVRRRRSDGMVFSLALLDLDHFKRINDTLGHQVGDEVLERFALAVLSRAASGQVSARYGGDEFLLAFSDTCKKEAETLLAGLLEEVRLSIWADPERKIALGFSAGLVDTEDFPASSTMTVKNLLELADERLYQAKASGRNRLCAHAAIGLRSEL
ncbi:MAG: histidine kinase N-terminal 7TM domain-containing protein [Synergistales bacterium]